MGRGEGKGSWSLHRGLAGLAANCHGSKRTPRMATQQAGTACVTFLVKSLCRAAIIML